MLIKRLIWLLWPLMLATDYATSNTLPLTKQSFTVDTKVLVIPRAGLKLNRQIARVSEAYSVEQKRAKLSFSIPSNEEYDQIYKQFWFEPGQLIMFNSGTGECFISNTAELAMGALRYNLSDYHISNVPEYIVGPARLLFFIDEHKNELKLAELSTTFFVRNIPCLMYSFTHTDSRSRKLDIQVFYSGSSLGNVEQQLPVKVNITSNTESIVVEYSRVQVFKIDFFSEALSETSDTELSDDFQITTSCSHIMKPVELFSQQDSYSKFSFEIEMRSGNDWEYKIGVEQVFEMSAVYDLRLGLMRLKNDIRGRTPSILYKTFDFNRGLSYLVEELGGTLSDLLVTNCLIYKSERNLNVTMGQSLLGGDDFVYMGKAKYRGLDTKVYKSRSAKLPLWLENPIEYKTSQGQTKVHSSSTTSNGNPSLVSIFVYLSDQETPVPVLMTIKQDGYIHRINFYNFVWDTHHSVRELFSLASMCSDQRKKAEVELVLEGEDERVSQLTLPNSHLESSLLEFLQSEYTLPLVMVHSFELKKINKAIFVSFVVADHQKEMSDFVFVGYGKYEEFRLHNEKAYQKHLTFDRCAQIASKLGDEMTFGWSQSKHTCIVEEGLMTESSNNTSFILTQQFESEYEVYSMRKRKETNRFSMQWLNEIYWIKRKFMNSTLNLYTDASRTSALHFHPEKFITTTTSMLDSSRNESALVGLGLLKDEQSWDVKSSNTKEQTGNKIETIAGAMSLYQCRTKCLHNPLCESYSICQRSTELECMNSRYNFTDPNLIQQLANGVKGNQVQQDAFRVDIDGKQVSLLRRSYCTIYNKQYMDLYKPQTAVSMVVFRGQLMDAYSREDCAQRCFQINAELLAQDAKMMLRISTIYQSYLPDQDLDELHELLAEQRNMRRRMCNGFYFVPQSNVNAYTESGGSFENFLSDQNSTKTKPLEGYCKLDQHKVDSVVDSSDGNFMRISFIHHYAYRFDHLYEKFSGLKLKPSPLSREQEQTYLYHSGGLGDNGPNCPLVPLRDLLDAGYNFQRTVNVHDELTCASICLSGRLGPWPACKSFDTELDENSGTMTCYLNSIALSEAMNRESVDLVEESKMKGKARFHFEPRELVLLESTEKKEMKILELEELIIVSSHLRVNPFLSFSIIVLVIVGCGYLGLKAGQLVIKMRNQHSSNVPLITIDFVNQVTAEGSIR